MTLVFIHTYPQILLPYSIGATDNELWARSREGKQLLCDRGRKTADMMDLSSQTIGLIFGVMVFGATMLATLLLLLFGGSFKRIREQV